MRISKPLAVVLLQLLAGPSLTSANSCDEINCPLTERCTTVTRTTGIHTATSATCAPTPTCDWVYHGCEPGGRLCCSSYCAATKCRATDPKWPNCAEDMGTCSEDGDCCYKNECRDGFCRKPE